MKKNAKSTPIADAALQHDFKVTITMNEKEYNAVSRYLDRYKIKNRNRWYRETILTHVLQKLEQDHPTLFSEHEMRR